jgi:hypothetical protein
VKLSSKNKTILLFSDPHQEVDKARKIIKAEQPDLTVCLGDWFDSIFYNSLTDVEATCSFLKKYIYEKSFVTLMGNHDLHYLYHNATTICSGYERGKDLLITEFFTDVLMPTFRSRFRWYVWIDDFLCTHAGLSPIHLPPAQNLDEKSLSEFLNREIARAEDALIGGERFWLYGAGSVRGGRQNRGGIVWLDFNHEFEPIEGLKQIVGHTSSKAIRPHHTDGIINVADCENLCIDCHLNEYLIIRDGKLTIKKFIDL